MVTGCMGVVSDSLTAKHKYRKSTAKHKYRKSTAKHKYWKSDAGPVVRMTMKAY